MVQKTVQEMFANLKGKPMTYLGKRKKKDEIHVEMLDYGWIDECSDADKLRGIIDLLKSGKEGLYPHLERHAEARLINVLPEKEAKKIIVMNTEASQHEVHEEISALKDWMKEVGTQDTSLKMSQQERNNSTANNDSRPPVRGQKAPPKKPKAAAAPVRNAPAITDGSTTKAGIEGSAAKHTHASQYFRAWEKYDADGEVEKIEEQDAIEQAAHKQAKTDYADREKRRQTQAQEELRRLMGDVDFGTMSTAERSFCAIREKQKGNECFKAGEVTEALVFYTKSICLDPNSSVVYANRALAHLREKNFEQAEDDCTKALEIDPTYLKALSRRGMTRHRRGKYRLAIEDFEKALQLDDTNIELGKLLKKSKEKFAETEGDNAAGTFRRVMIEDVEDDSESDTESEEEEEEEAEEDEEEESEEEEVDVAIKTRASSASAVKIRASIKGRFTKCASFQGGKAGFVFKKGHSGVGYYKETDGSESDDEEDVPIKAASSRIAIVEDDDSESDDEEDVPIKTSSSRIAIVEDDDSESDDEEDVPIKASSSRIAIVEDDDSESEDEEDVPIKTSSSRIAIVDEDDESEEEEAEEVDTDAKVLEQVQDMKQKGAGFYSAGDMAAALAQFDRCAACVNQHLSSPGSHGQAAALQALWVACSSNKAQCLLQLRKFGECVAACTVVLERESGNVKCRLRRATALENLDKEEEAIAEYDHVLSREPAQTQALAGKKRVEERLAQREEQEAKEEAEKEDPEANARRATELKDLGNQCFKASDLDGAIGHYTEALEHTSADAGQLFVSLLSNRAWAYCRSEAWTLAESDCDAILGVDPDHLKALFRRGQARRALRILPGAQEDLERVIVAEPNNQQASAELELVRRAMASDEAEAAAAARVRASAKKPATTRTIAKEATSTRIAIVDEDDSSESDDEEDVPIKASSSRIAIVEDDESSEEEEDVPIKAASTRIAIVDDDESSEEEEDVPIKAASTRIAIVDDDESSEEEEDVPIKASSTRIAIVDDDESSEEEEDVPIKKASAGASGSSASGAQRVSIPGMTPAQVAQAQTVMAEHPAMVQMVAAMPAKQLADTVGGMQAMPVQQQEQMAQMMGIPPQMLTLVRGKSAEELQSMLQAMLKMGIGEAGVKAEEAAQPTVVASPPAPPAQKAAPKKVATTTATAPKISTVSSSPTNSPKNSASSSQKAASPKKSPKTQDAAALAKKAMEKARGKGSAAALALPKTGYEFERVWRSVKADRASFCKYLMLVKPASYKKLFKQGIETEIATDILKCVHENMIPAEGAHALATLLALSKISRFNTVLMFMGAQEKAAIKSTFEELGRLGVDETKLKKAKKAYNA
jgi:tetratricopeptide (TPR) repeat protein